MPYSWISKIFAPPFVPEEHFQILKPQDHNEFCYLLSPPNEVSEGSMKRAPYVCVCACVRASGLKMLKFASSLSFLGRFWFCLFYLIGFGAGLQNFYTEFWNSLIMQIYSKSMKMLLLCHFLADFGFCLFWSDRAWCGQYNPLTEGSLVDRLLAE